jgi:cell shape-determining protein MreC
MNYANRNKPTPYFQSSRARIGMSLPARIVLFFVAIVGLSYIFMPRVLPRIFLSIISPVWKADSDARLGTATIEQLTETYLQVSRNEALNSAVLKENEELKDSMSRTKVAKPVLATILKKPPYSAYDSFILDVGEKEGIVKGNRVYALGNIPIGVIAEVTGQTSQVQLYSSSGQKFDILIGPSHIEATAQGRGGGHFEVSLPRDTKIKKGDEVTIPTLSDSFIGIVDGVASEVSEPFAIILFHQPINLYEQRWVIVDTNV